MKRRAYFERFLQLASQTDVRRAVVLMGPRRVGKTVLLHHVIARLLEDGLYEPRDIGYVSLDQPLYTRLSIEEVAQELRGACGGREDREVDMVHLDKRQKPGWFLDVKWSDRPGRKPEELTGLADLSAVPTSVYCYAVGRDVTHDPSSARFWRAVE